jgi:protein SHQ1
MHLSLNLIATFAFLHCAIVLDWIIHLLDPTECQKTFLGLVDIIFAYAYNHRTTQGENSVSPPIRPHVFSVFNQWTLLQVESGWTVCKLSSTLSWLEVNILVSMSFIFCLGLIFQIFNNLKDVLVASHRRCLVFPLFRSWKLACVVLNDVREIFAIGEHLWCCC